MTRRLFGTDGVRGRAGVFPLDRRTIRRLGAALVRALPSGAGAPHLLIGRDTRESGEWIEREFAFGAGSAGARTASAGVISTPAVAYLTRRSGFAAGVVISASHNPFEDNGIKVFSGAGEKYTEALEAEVEALVSDPSWREPDGDATRVDQADLVGRYLGHAREAIAADLPRHVRRIAVDCANGATYALAPPLLRDLGFDVVTTGCSPDGRNINLRCGSTHPETLAGLVLEHHCDVGIAFDGDGDRAILIDASGRTVNGDTVMFICARQMKAAGRLRGDAIVATVMSNVGLEIALKRYGIGMVRCPVGDKYVMEELITRGLTLGGEQSGHVIFTESLFTGDGLVTALNVLKVMAETGRSLGDLAGDLTTYPQVLLNVRVRDRRDWTTLPGIVAATSRIEERLNGRGRLLIRYSGTEPLLRIMIEGERDDEIRAWAEEIAAEARAALGEQGSGTGDRGPAEH
ncbi:MAG: phosphoglucosamine mutase [Acidobacteriota bacterium]